MKIDKCPCCSNTELVLEETKGTSKKAIKRWLRNVGPLYEDLWLLRKADRAGNKAKAGKPLVTMKMQELDTMVQEIRNAKEPMSLKELAIDGNVLIEEFGLKPGPLFGMILNKLLEEVVADATKNTRETLIAMVKEMLANGEERQSS